MESLWILIRTVFESYKVYSFIFYRLYTDITKIPLKEKTKLKGQLWGGGLEKTIISLMSGFVLSSYFSELPADTRSKLHTKHTTNT